MDRPTVATVSACSACRGGAIACKGGGNKDCIRRDPRPSHCAGIMDTYGCVRFIVAHQRTFKHHVRPDEILIVVPDLLVHEPIAWSDIPGCLRRIERAIDEWIARGIPNEPHAREAVVMHKLRRKEQDPQSLDLCAICET
jgi:hypothetical protein